MRGAGGRIKVAGGRIMGRMRRIRRQVVRRGQEMVYWERRNDEV